MDGSNKIRWIASSPTIGGPRTFLFSPRPPTAKELLGLGGSCNYLNALESDNLSKMQLNPPPEMKVEDILEDELTLLGSLVATEQEINHVLTEWVKEYKSQGPPSEDLKAVGSFFKGLIMDEDCEEEALECVRFFRHSLQRVEGGESWLPASDFLADAVNEALEAMGRPRVNFGVFAQG